MILDEDQTKPPMKLQILPQNLFVNFMFQGVHPGPSKRDLRDATRGNGFIPKEPGTYKGEKPIIYTGIDKDF